MSEPRGRRAGTSGRRASIMTFDMIAAPAEDPAIVTPALCRFADHLDSLRSPKETHSARLVAAAEIEAARGPELGEGGSVSASCGGFGIQIPTFFPPCSRKKAAIAWPGFSLTEVEIGRTRMRAKGPPKLDHALDDRGLVAAAADDDRRARLRGVLGTAPRSARTTAARIMGSGHNTGGRARSGLSCTRGPQASWPASTNARSGEARTSGGTLRGRRLRCTVRWSSSADRRARRNPTISGAGQEACGPRTRCRADQRRRKHPNA